MPEWNLELSLYLNRHINNFVSVLILENLDALISWLIISWVIGFVSLRDLLDDSGRLHFDSFTEFDNSP